MLRYVMAAQALRAMSANSATRSLYRKLANWRGGKSRGKGIPPHYISRADGNLRAIEAAGAIADGMTVLELGTGWAHWEALYTRLFYDVKIIAFDVWDNRQFAGFLRFASELRTRLDHEVPRSAEQLARARATLDRVIATHSFDEAYEMLGFTYLIDSNGSLASLPTASLDLQISSDVMEHVDRAAVPALLAEMRRTIRPGGYTSHQIVPADHLAIYDRSVNSKNYLRYPDWAWSLLFSNQVQYVNRVQLSEWVAYFKAAGFADVEGLVLNSTAIDALSVSKRFSGLPQEDLAATVLRLSARG